MVLDSSSGSIIENSVSVVKELISDSHTTGNGPSLIDFVHHGLDVIGWDIIVLLNGVDVIWVLSPTSLAWPTVLALDLIRTGHSVIQSVGEID